MFDSSLVHWISYSTLYAVECACPVQGCPMDTSDEATILEVARQLEGQPIDLIINNAGINLPGSLETGTKEVLMRLFEVNAVGPFLVARTLLPNLQLAANTRGFAFVVSCLPSWVDSLYGYGTSKAALNMITRSLAFDLQPKDIVCTLDMLIQT
ncbi:Short-chain dehydrogenase/reductase, conserved site [Phytophthora cactorum]|nr:Short-chain dehydrogenase/reductase, conserved site [Phytophthora cactorum]